MVAWLKCKIDSGMFSDEVAVTYPATEHWRKSVFVPSDCVRSDALNTIGKVYVKVLIKDGERFAVLPSSYQDIVKVDEADLYAS